MSSNNLPLILQIQADAINSTISTVQVVRTAKVAASKLGLTDAIEWIDNELNGYHGPNAENLPEYRIASGECQGWNPFHGWQPVIISGSPEMQEMICTAYIQQPLASIEELSANDSNPVMPYSSKMQNLLMELTRENTRFQLRLSKANISHVLNGVRQLVLDWSLNLEQAGILGENMSFKQNERNAAQIANQNYFIQNAGVIGNVSDQASISISQSANIDIKQAQDVITQCEQLLPNLPDQIRTELQPIFHEAAAQMEQTKPDQGKLRQLLTSIKTICEGAAGNVLATGIVSSIAALL